MAKTDKPDQKTTDASLLTEVLAEISCDRRAAHADLDAANDELVTATRKENAKLTASGVLKTWEDAQADLESFTSRYEKRLPRQDFDSRKRVLQRSLDEATVKKEVAVAAAEKRLAPLRRRAEIILERCKKLAREWDAEGRRAKAASVDMKAYWTPESGTPTTEAMDTEPEVAT